MTISHPVTRSRSTSNSTARQNTISSNNEPADDHVSEETEEFHLRGSAELPPIIHYELDRPLLLVEGKGWKESPTLGSGRNPSSVLTCLMKSCHPGLIQYRGKTVVASTWKHYQAAKDTAGRSAADVVEEGFWLRFRFDPADEYGARAHVGDCCSGLIGGAIYYARIKATMDHFRKVEGRKICDKIAGQFYLTEEQYRDQRQMWIKQDCWNILAAEWSSVEFKMRSIKNHGNRYSPRFKPHKGGSNSIATIRQKMSKKLGRDVSEVEAWVYTHRGSNPEDSNSLNTDEATACLEKYKEKAIELNGPEFDWLHSPVDVRALYQCSCGRPHGKWALFNGIVNDREVLPELKNNRALSLAAKRRRQEVDERARKEASESRLAKEYAQKMFDWSKIVLSQNETMQKFMENVAAHTGMPAELVPSPLPQPPPPPGFCVSTSPLQSIENAPTFGSVIREETPDETISRIANGVFRCHENATTSGGGTYSPPQEEFPFF